MFKKNDVCRLCLSKKPTIHIFDDESHLFNKIRECCGLEIFPNDDLPKNICVECYNSLDMVYTFRKKCKNSEKHLRNLKIPKRKRLDIVKIEYEHSMTFFEEPKVKQELNTKECRAEDILDIQFQEDDHLENLQIDSKSNLTLKTKTKIKRHNQNPEERRIRKSIKRKKRPSKLCPICGIVVKSGFSIHMKAHDGARYICDYCNKEFASKYNLGVHIILHQDKSIACEYCGKVFSNKRYCTKHVDLVHNRKFACHCEVCGKELRNKMSLKVHMLAHTGSKPYPCSLCNKMFRYKTQVQEHLREHTGEKPFQCKFCDSKFRIKGYLVAHERLHTGQAPYHCTVCPKQFAQLPNLKSHFRHNHKEMEFSYTYEK